MWWWISTAGIRWEYSVKIAPVHMWWWISTAQIRWQYIVKIAPAICPNLVVHFYRTEHIVKIAPAICPNVVVDFYRRDKMGTQCQNSTSHLSKCGGGFLPLRFGG